MNIEIDGIKTNNLKNIDVKIQKNAINLVIGPSGSGKSSLAYDTIAQIGLHEYKSMFDDNVSEVTYNVDGYRNMVPTVPVKQMNNNNNYRSTIASYFGLSTSIRVMYASYFDVDEDFFSLGLENNTCQQCFGRGYIEELDMDRIIDTNKRIQDNPFRCWKRYGDFYNKILVHFCEDENIDITKRFFELPVKDQRKLLYGESTRKYKISYKHGYSTSTRTTRYYGVMTEVPMRKNFKMPFGFYSKFICPECGGAMYSSRHMKYKMQGLSVGEFLTMPFSDLQLHLERIKKVIKNVEICLESILRFVNKANEMYLGHLYFARTIPTLSGGELQRLKMIQVFNTQLKDLLVVLDEPFSGLSGKEKKNVLRNIIMLKEHQTVIVVDHSIELLKVAQKVIALGEKSGSLGGEIIDAQRYIHEESQTELPLLHSKNTEDEVVRCKYRIYDYNGAEVKFEKRGLNLITGPSGVGKSIFLREYLSRYYDSYVYVNQRPLNGNVNSNVATVLEIANLIFDIFANKYNTTRSFFSNMSGKEGVCSHCKGYGYKEVEGYKIICRECKGTGFNKVLSKYTIDRRNILDIWDMTILEANNFFESYDRRITKKLKAAEQLALEHLKIGQLTSTFSGGENVRMKLLQCESSKADFFGIDEPFKGLSRTEMFLVMKYLYKIRDKQKTILVVDHNEEMRKYFDCHIELKINKKNIIID